MSCRGETYTLYEGRTVATTRPETMLGDTAVAINPKDPRAAALDRRGGDPQKRQRDPLAARDAAAAATPAGSGRARR